MTGRRKKAPDTPHPTERYNPRRHHDDDTECFDVEELNERYAVVIIGGKVAILDECWKSPNQQQTMLRERTRFMAPDSFEKWLANQLCRDGDRRVPVAQLWLRHPSRRQYEGVLFNPALPPGGSCQNGYYNLWEGFSVEPNPAGSCAIFLDHIRTNVANGSEEHANYILAWFADLVQNPADRKGISLVLRGKMGTGKTIVGVAIGRLFEGNYALVDDPRYIVGNFNSHLASLLLLQADEGFWAGDKHSEGRLKGLVTSDRQMIEMKGKDPIQVGNYLHLLVTSNSDWVVPAGHEERRFAVFDVGDHCMQDHEYFGNMLAELEAGGYGALLHFLLKFDLNAVDLRRIPTTAALFEQKVSSLPPVEAWWFTCLQRGWVTRKSWNEPGADEPAEVGWREEAECESVHGSYVAYCDRLGIRHKKSPPQFGIELHKLIPSLSRTRTRSGSARTYVYLFPSLEECRRTFERSMRTAIDWETGVPSPQGSPDDEDE